MNGLKIIIFLSFLFLLKAGVYGAKKATTGNKALFERIIRKVEDHLYQNYYTDSIQPIVFYEYTCIDSLKHLLNAVFIQAPNKPVWFYDFQYCLKRYKKNYVMLPRYWKAKFYEEKLGEKYSCITVRGRGWYVVPFWDYEQNALCQHVDAIYTRRLEQAKKERSAFERDYNKLGEIAYKMDKTFTTLGDEWEDFEVSDTLFEGQECYRLVRKYGVQILYGESGKTRLECLIREGVICGSDEELNDLRRLADFWGNTISTGEIERIVNKKDYALLQLTTRQYVDNDKGVKLECENTVDRFVKMNGIYQQVMYRSKVLSYVWGTTFRNTDNIYIYLIKLPSSDNFPESELKSIPLKMEHLTGGYEVFCTRVNQPDAEMLEQWERIK